MGRDFRLNYSVTLPRPREEVFDFFANAENLELLTPPWLHFSILSPLPVEMKLGAMLEYRIRLRGIPLTWVSQITQWGPPFQFEDIQVRGPYRKWVHRHFFEETANGTLAIDDVQYGVPGGAIVDKLFVAGELRRIFDYRRAKLLELFLV